MKRLMSLVLCLCMLTACGSADGATTGNTSAAEDTSVAENADVGENVSVAEDADAEGASAGESVSTAEELFLQNAYWYLQSDEKELFTWENGVLEDYCAQESHMVISPEGEIDIQSRALQRVKYVYSAITENVEAAVSLYFDGDTFVGTDAGSWVDGSIAEPTQGRFWDGDVTYWLFLSSPEITMDETLTITCVLKNNGEKRTFRAYAPYIMYLEYYQNASSCAGGIDSSAQELTLDAGEVFIETRTLTPADFGSEDWCPFSTGPCTLLTFVEMHPVGEDAEDIFRFSISRWAEFTITE